MDNVLPVNLYHSHVTFSNSEQVERVNNNGEKWKTSSFSVFTVIIRLSLSRLYYDASVTVSMNTTQENA